MIDSKYSVDAVCFGEILWDIFPDGKRIGGAPFNVAYNLSKMGINCRMISRVGNDELGDEILKTVESRGISTKGIQVDSKYNTGVVLASFDENKEASYDIVNNVAWDHIECLDEDLKIVSDAKVFVFGSLATRNQSSKNTLMSLMECKKFNVFDVNFRPPFVDHVFIKEILHHTDLAKFNKAELRTVLEFIGKDYTTEEDSIKYVQDYFKLKEIIISKGSKGAIYYKEDEQYQFPAVTIEINDTVGSGDSFLAGFLSKRIVGANPFDSMETATALGAFITSKQGACPEYTFEEFKVFTKKFPADYSKVLSNMDRIN